MTEVDFRPLYGALSTTKVEGEFDEEVQPVERRPGHGREGRRDFGT
jgi:hypothetical protein